MLPSLFCALLVALQEPVATEDLAELRAVVIGPAEDECLERGTRIASTMDFLYDHGFNVVCPVVWRASGPLWPCTAAKNAGAVEVDPKFFDPKFKSRDVVTEIAIEAHRAGLELVPIIDIVIASNRNGVDAKGQGPDGALSKSTGPAITAPLDALDRKAQAYTREVVIELARFHEVDGIAFDAHGLSAYAPLDAKGLATLGDFVASLRAAIDEFDPSIRFVLVDGGAAQAPWMERGLFDVAAPRTSARDAHAWSKWIDSLIAEPWCASEPRRVAPFLCVADGALVAEPDFVLAAIAHDREKRVQGEVISSLAALRRDDEKLASELAREPYYGVALVPWRKGVAWRTKSAAVQPNAGEGQWEWSVDSTGVRVLQISNAARGNATWTLHAIEKGDYDLFTWIPPDADVGRRAAFMVATRTGPKPCQIDPTHPKFKGWVYVGTVPMGRREVREVLSLAADGTEPTKVTVAGPMVAVLSRRPRAQ